jgi:predicted RNase H-like HicB family nuclease
MTYRVQVTREGPDWIADVPDIPGAHTSASTLWELLGRVQEVIGVVLGRPESERFEVEFELIRPAPVSVDAAQPSLPLRTVDVTAQWGSAAWVFECEEAGAVSQCDELDQADAEVREAIAHQLGLGAGDFAIRLTVEPPRVGLRGTTTWAAGRPAKLASMTPEERMEYEAHLEGDLPG